MEWDKKWHKIIQKSTWQQFVRLLKENKSIKLKFKQACYWLVDQYSVINHQFMNFACAIKHGILRDHSSWKIYLRLWKFIWNSLNSRHVNQIHDGEKLSISASNCIHHIWERGPPSAQAKIKKKKKIQNKLLMIW